MRARTYSRVLRSMTMLSMPYFLRSCPRRRPAGPLPMIATCVRKGVVRSIQAWPRYAFMTSSNFAKEKPWRPPSLVLEKDPPDHDRTRSVLNKVLSPAVMKTLRERFARAAAAKADGLLEIGALDASVEL